MARFLQQQDGNTSFRKLVQTMAFGHSTRDLDMVVHGDDFIVAGDGGDLDWL